MIPHHWVIGSRSFETTTFHQNVENYLHSVIFQKNKDVRYTDTKKQNLVNM